MDKAGDLLAFFFDKNFADKADRYSGLFRGWEDLVSTDLAQHCRIIDIRNHLVEIETDHPGWKQRFQFKQRMILERLQKRYPELEIRSVRVTIQSTGLPQRPTAKEERVSQPPETSPSDLDTTLTGIPDEDFRASLKRLGEAIERKNDT